MVARPPMAGVISEKLKAESSITFTLNRQLLTPELRLWLGGKSELYRARRSLAATGGNPKESATERETVPAMVGTRVKR